MQPLLTRYRCHAPVSVLHVAEAAEELRVKEVEIFQLAHRWWYAADIDEATLERAFSAYLLKEDVPAWVRHYCRRVLNLAAVGQLDPREFGVDEPTMHRFNFSEQRFAYLATAVALAIYVLFLA